MASAGFSPIFLRASTAYGYSPRIRFDLVLNNLTAWALTTGKVFLKSDGSPWRPIVHVEDIGRAYVAALKAPIELVQAETQVKLREEDVIVAEAAVQEAEDALKEVINIPEMLGSWNIRLHPSDQPTFEPISSLVVEDKLHDALRQRPDIIESQLSIESREIAREEARNQRLPRLDLEASGSLSSFGDDVGEGLSDLPEINGYRWLVGLQFEYPLGNRAAQNNLTRRKLELRQAAAELAHIHHAIGDAEPVEAGAPLVGPVAGIVGDGEHTGLGEVLAAETFPEAVPGG